MWACLIYLVGVGIVLYIRPSSMFRPGGTWREFGLGDSESCTLFPFWMFSIVWAIFSYVFASFITSISIPRNDGIEIYSESLLPPTSPSPTVKQPGYYILNPESVSANTGANYVYYGPEPPPPEELNSYIRYRR
jgi:hypothetical protein